MANVVIYIDMDGVLVDFDRGIREQFNLTEKFLKGLNASSKSLTKAQKARKSSVYDMILAKKEYWEELHLMKDGLELWDRVIYYKPIILTAAPKHGLGVEGLMFTQAREGKIKWVNKYLTSTDSSNFICTTSSQKKDFIHTRPGTQILIDDRPQNIIDWKDVGGIGILHKSTSSTLTELDAILGL